MRVSRFLRQRAQMNRTRYAVRALASVVLPSLVDSMRTMNDTLRIQGRMIARAAENNEREPTNQTATGSPSGGPEPLEGT